VGIPARCGRRRGRSFLPRARTVLAVAHLQEHERDAADQPERDERTAHEERRAAQRGEDDPGHEDEATCECASDRRAAPVAGWGHPSRVAQPSWTGERVTYHEGMADACDTGLCGSDVPPVIGSVLTGVGLTLDQAADRLAAGDPPAGLTPVQRRMVEEHAATRW